MIKYNKYNPKYKQKKSKYKIKTSKVERRFGNTLKRFGIKYETQKQLGTKFYDYYIPECRLLIEIDGNYWHGNTKYFPVLNKMQMKAKLNDKEKNMLAKVYGYKLLRFWEHETKNETKCIKLIKEHMSTVNNKIER